MSTVSVTTGRVLERLQTLKARRGGLKGVLTKRIRELRISADIDNTDVEEKLQVIEGTYGKILEVQDVIDQLVKDEELQEQTAYMKGIRAEMRSIRQVAAKSIQALQVIDAAKEQNEEAESLALMEDADADRELRGGVSDGEGSEADDIEPGDSASQTGRLLTSRTSLASVKAVSLMIQAEALQEKQELELEEFRIKQKKEALQLRLDLATAEAETAMEDLESCVPGPGRVSVRKSSPKIVTKAVQKTRRTVQEPTEESQITDVNCDIEDQQTLGGLVEVVKQGQQAMIDIVQMPKFGMVKFTGDPLKYRLFINAFDSKVGRSNADDITKLMLLHENCVQKPKELVEKCIGLGPDGGYGRARELLKERYGDDYTISQAWVKKVTAGSPLGPRDYRKLLEFSDDLNTCVDTLSAMGYLSEVSTQQVMLSIASKLPSYLRSRWVKDAQARRSNGKAPPGVCDLARFVASASKEVNDPLFSTLLPGANEVQDSKKPNRGKGASFSTVVQSEVKTFTEPIK